MGTVYYTYLSDPLARAKRDYYGVITSIGYLFLLAQRVIMT